MAVTNTAIADLFDEVANLLEIEAANPFRVRAYRNASRALRDWPTSLATSIENNEPLPKIPGVGKDLAEKISEIVKSRRLALLEELRKETPKALLTLLKIPGMGPKRVNALQAALGISSMEDLERALAEGRLSQVAGFGPKIEEKLRSEIERQIKNGATEQKRMLLSSAEQFAKDLLSHMSKSPHIKQINVAGSYRRRLESVGDLDFLVTTSKQASVMKHFLAYSEIDRVLAKGSTRATVVLNGGLQVDLRVVAEKSYGAALHYFTGSKAHNIAIRSLGSKRGLKINEYAVFRGTRKIAGADEFSVFRSVGLPYIEPELRENRGEIEAARDGKLPKLVELSEIRGDLHAHSKASDGRLSIQEMAQAAQRLGYEYLAITDHSQRLKIAHGLDAKRLAAQIREIDRLNEKLKDFRILKSIEVDILKDGSLDLPNSILSQLDFTVCSIHSYFDLPAHKQVERILRAMDNPYFNILGHPTGRLIGQRAGFEIELEKIMRAALERGIFLEINAQPERMDLTDVHCRQAKEMGLKLVISTDAHSDRDLNYMRFGVSQARRGWLEKKDVLNTRSWNELSRLFQRKAEQRQAA